MSVMVLNDLFLKMFGLPLLDPMIGYQKMWKVVNESRKLNPKPRYNEIGEKHRFKGYLEIEQEKLQEQKAYENRLKRGISLDSDYHMYQSTQSIVPKKQRPFGSQSPDLAKKRKPNKYGKYNKEPLANQSYAYAMGTEGDELRDSLSEDMLGYYK
jgi:hypothetical protein